MENESIKYENDLISIASKVTHIKNVCENHVNCPQRVNCYATGKECTAVIILNRIDYDGKYL